MEYFRLQIGCLAVLIYVAVVYFQGCAKYHVRMRASHFWKLLILGVATVIFDGGTAWATGNAGSISPIWNYVFHALSFIGLDSTIFMLAVYMLHMMDCFPKKRPYLVYMPLLLNIVLLVLTIGLPDYRSGQANGYSSGPAIIICFTMIGFYIAATTMISYKNFNLINSEKRRGIITFLFAYAIISVIQMVFADSHTNE